MLAALWIFAIEPLLATRKEPSWASSLRWRYRLRKGFAVPLALVWLGEQGGAALPGCLRCSWPKMREMRNCGRARLDTRVQLGSKCGVQGRFRRIETRIRLQSGSCRCNARFFVHHAVFYQACCPRRVASIGRDLLWVLLRASKHGQQTRQANEGRRANRGRRCVHDSALRSRRVSANTPPSPVRRLRQPTAGNLQLCEADHA